MDLQCTGTALHTTVTLHTNRETYAILLCSSPWIFFQYNIPSMYIHTNFLNNWIKGCSIVIPNTSSGRIFGGSHTFISCLSPHDTLFERIYCIESEDKSFGYKVSLWMKEIQAKLKPLEPNLCLWAVGASTHTYFFPPPNCRFHITSSGTNRMSRSIHNA